MEKEAQLSDVSVEAMAEKAKQIAVERAAEALTRRILAKVGKDAEVKKMRQESIAKAREKLEKKGRKSATAEQPTVSTEVRSLSRGQKKRADKPVIAPAAPAVEAPPPVHS